MSVALAILLGPVGRWALLGVAFAGIGGVGFLKGVEWQEGKQARAEVQVITKRVELVRKVQVGQEKVSAAYEKGRAERDKDFANLQTKFDAEMRDVLAALPAMCTWNDDVLGLLNKARRGERLTADSSKPPAGVPGFGSAYRWETAIHSAANAVGRQGVCRLSEEAPRVEGCG